MAAEFDWLRGSIAAYKAYQAYTISDKEVMEYVKQTVRYMDRNHKVLPESHSYSKRLKKLVSGLTKVNGVPLNFKVYEINDEMNAFACADGSVRIYSSLMDVMNDDELLGIIGHEVGHIGKHHTRKAIKNALLTDALREAIASSSGNLGVLADSQLGSLSQIMINAQHSRTQEKEADDYGYEFLKKSGKNPGAMIQALEKLQSVEKHSSRMTRYITGIFSSHPDTNARILRLKQHYKKDGY